MSHYRVSYNAGTSDLSQTFIVHLCNSPASPCLSAVLPILQAPYVLLRMTLEEYIWVCVLLEVSVHLRDYWLFPDAAGVKLMNEKAKAGERRRATHCTSYRRPFSFLGWDGVQRFYTFTLGRPLSFLGWNGVQRFTFTLGFVVLHPTAWQESQLGCSKLPLVLALFPGVQGYYPRLEWGAAVHFYARVRGPAPYCVANPILSPN
ncbi:hypothetical protein BKA70DRAFT_1234930 [Coprinopsis sp. MPI-PUGE-AT-0042]|nr:hypothetical protein BKA70DRAFT_1234930 [Coprinopsis sp. MPI-PUGE-AT-0042]